jgi:glyoxylase-like metal-dependent hydrolase (beta-lactamase superfamily II)
MALEQTQSSSVSRLRINVLSNIYCNIETLSLGAITIRVDHTPGHTLESSCYVIVDSKGEEVCAFTGDTLFLGDVGRPDLAASEGITTADLAGMLYDSIHGKVLTLPDTCLVFPAHGAGSACGKAIASGLHSTIGEQRKSNYAL